MRSSALRAFDMCSRWRTDVRARLRALNVRAERESEIVEELANQLEATYEAARAEGRTDAEAMDRAHAEVPDWEAFATTIERIESPSRVVTADKAAHRGFRMANLLQDFRYAFRSLSRTPGYTTTALTTLMLGFGLATLAIAVVDRILVRPLPYKDAERLMLVKATVPPEGRNTVEITQLWLVASLILLVFLVASVNVAGLLTARAAARVRDVAVRLALGAGWRRLIQHSFAEALLLGVAGAVLGAGLAHASLGLLRATPALSLPRLAEVQIDVRVVSLLAAVVIALAGGAALLPLLVVRGLHATGTLRTGHETSSRPLMRFRAALMTGQTAFVFLLLAAALLASRMRSLLSQPLGFDTSNVVTMRIAAPPERYGTRAATTGFFAELLDAIRQHPTVRSAGLISNLPLGGSTGSTLTIQGREDVPLALRPTIGWQWTSPGYFAALGMPIVSGRDFTADDVTRTTHVTVINETLARQHVGAENPIGQRVYFGGFGAGGPPERRCPTSRD